MKPDTFAPFTGDYLIQNRILAPSLLRCELVEPKVENIFVHALFLGAAADFHRNYHISDGILPPPYGRSATPLI